MKKISLILAIILALSFVGCTNEKTPAPETQTEIPAPVETPEPATVEPESNEQDETPIINDEDYSLPTFDYTEKDFFSNHDEKASALDKMLSKDLVFLKEEEVKSSDKVSYLSKTYEIYDGAYIYIDESLDTKKVSSISFYIQTDKLSNEHFIDVDSFVLSSVIINEGADSKSVMNDLHYINIKDGDNFFTHKNSIKI